MREGIQGYHKFYDKGMTMWDPQEVFRQVAFIGYYFHWPKEEILSMPHLERIKYCGEISRINRMIKGEKNLFQP